MEQNVTLEYAISATPEYCNPSSGSNVIPLGAAYGSVLAEDIVAQRNVPPFDRSPFDGYAFIAADSANSPVTLKVLGEIAAGSGVHFEVTHGTAVKLLTGAPVPKGADVIVKFEDTEFTAESVTLLQAYSPGNIVPMGEDVKAGELIAVKGEYINPALAGMLAAQGIERVKVFKRPMIGILSTGNELQGSGETNGKIFDSNRYSLSAAVETAGAEARFLGTAGDSAESIIRFIKSHSCDMLISTGGMGKSDHDFTLAAFEALGANTLIHNGDFMSGGTFAFCVLGGIPCFLLSGNPASAMVTFYALIQPCIRKLRGMKDYSNMKIKALIPDGYPKPSPRMRLLTAKLFYRESTSILKITERGKGTISALNGINAIAVAPENDKPIAAGTILEAYLV
jgi:molybdopterin molybdotransferase